MNDLKKTQEEVVSNEIPNSNLEKYETPTVEVVEVELEGTILNTSDMEKNVRF